MARRVALAFLAMSSPVMLLALVAGTPAGEVIFTLLAAAFPVALSALGAQRHGSLGSSLLLDPPRLLGLLAMALTRMLTQHKIQPRC